MVFVTRLRDNADFGVPAAYRARLLELARDELAAH